LLVFGNDFRARNVYFVISVGLKFCLLFCAGFPGKSVPCVVKQHL
jgi:hypothetical protein